MAGLGGSGNGGGFGGPRGGGNGSKWGWYAGQVQSSVAAALKRNNKTRTASMKIQVRIWPNAAGRVTRAQLDGTTGDHALDEALQEILNGLQLQEPPPAGMPSPIVLRLTAARRP
jgi:TonB family protein